MATRTTSRTPCPKYSICVGCRNKPWVTESLPHTVVGAALTALILWLCRSVFRKMVILIKKETSIRIAMTCGHSRATCSRQYGSLQGYLVQWCKFLISHRVGLAEKKRGYWPTLRVSGDAFDGSEASC